MAVTSAPLVWKFYRQVGSDVNAQVGGVVHYYDEWSQTIFLNGGMKTRTAEVPDGHWATSELNPSFFLNAQPYTNLRQDHPSKGVLYFSATDGTTLTFLRYIYGMDLSHITESWNWTSQSDNAIAQFSGAVQNLGPDIFSFDATLFQPGARIILSVMMGNSQPYPIGVAWLDECNYDIASETVDISGRNSIGYFLKDQTFDDTYSFTGISSDIMTAILTYAGIKKINVQTGAGTMPFAFNPSDSLLDGIKEMLSAYTTSSSEWKILELPDGTVCVGYESWLANLLPNSYYSFDEGKDVFKRKTTKLSDSSYVAIRVTGKDTSDVDLTPVTVDVNNFPYWSLGAHRTKHLTAPDGFTQAELQTWAEGQAEKYQYIGIGEDFTGPFRPQLIVGDVAEVVEGEEGTSLGLITEVRQVFSRKDGFKTEFSVDSGGVATDGANYVVYSRAAEVSGFNRRQRVIDLVRFIAKK